jgi:hypothetical protein
MRAIWDRQQSDTERTGRVGLDEAGPQQNPIGSGQLRIPRKVISDSSPS